ncbi:FAD-dependent monooxygenase [Sphaerisporangium sp. B11E5]|uniref:FAD-dependent oxidoreductase n=1 Tax=Sphaerisporangium sp. B11E5 TaxID=3153563 RepID=UPI00325E5968
MSRHAVVAGGSLGGLLAARVLADHFERVTVIERDRLPSGGAHRRGVPQGPHTHCLIASGRDAIEELLPGFTAAVVAQGGTVADMQGECRWYTEGHRMRQAPIGMHVLLAGRALLESHVRERVRGIGNVFFHENAEVAGLTVDGERVTGVRLLDPAQGTVEADLVVDATGRGARGTAWLRDAGFTAPEEDRVDVGIVYTTRRFRRLPEHMGHDRALVITTTADNRRGGAMIAQEGDRWIVSLFGYLGETPPPDLDGFTDFAGTLAAKDIHDVVRNAEPVGEALVIRFPASRRRRYERLGRFPEGYLVLGDALCSFNPIYAQGMAVTAIEARLLGESLRAAGPSRLAEDFFARVTPVVDAAWDTAVGGDLKHPGIEGERSPGLERTHAFLSQVYLAASRDAEVARSFVRVVNLTDGPDSLADPAFAGRVQAAAAG